MDEELETATELLQRSFTTEEAMLRRVPDRWMIIIIIINIIIIAYKDNYVDVWMRWDDDGDDYVDCAWEENAIVRGGIKYANGQIKCQMASITHSC